MFRRLIVLLLLAVVVLPTPGSAQALDTALYAAAARCGVERWPVKVMADDAAARVNLTPVPTTIGDLRALPAPPSLPQRGRIAPVELTTYTITAGVVAAKLEEDSDIHLVIASPTDSSQTMVVEYPDPDCALTTAPELVAQFRTARTAFIDAFGQPPGDRFLPLSGTAQITGVGFFDFLHGQRGMAPNGIELHPVLAHRPAAQAPGAPPPAQPDQACFPETGQCVAGRFRQYWEQNGGLAVFGFPTTPARPEVNRDTGQTYLTQWFERNRFELHEENRPPYDVLLGRLGDDRLRARGESWHAQPRDAPRAQCLYFEQTGRNVCDQAAGLGFRAYWLGRGLADPALDGYARSLALFGLPLTDARTEVNTSGDVVLTQWFERARFEWHPTKPDAFKVLLGLLGRELGPPVVPGPPGPPPPPPPPEQQGVQVSAWVSDASPAQRTNVTVYGKLTVDGRGVAGVPMTATWQYRTTTSTCTGTSNAEGVASCTRNISTATVGYTVTIVVAFNYGGRVHQASTSFTPR